ncbi:FprA family A-type flavoprotein [Zavarzinia sp.]|uniref:FprA family A-type flavoprotein n=1 Tax=Zavarzinia sp. TaxID=2027920 RepID=UPI0035670ACC
MKPREFVPNVHLIGAVDWDRRLFDALIPLPDGTSYNAYYVHGSEKNVLLDTVDPVQWRTLSLQLDQLPAPDYLVIHHVEQDHSGSTPMLLDRFPDLTVVCNEKARGMLLDHLHIDDARFHIVADGDELSLGDKTLKFVFTPWVHWPETMCTWLEEDRILFSCDFFGSHYATNDVFADKHKVYDGAKRYYAEIMMPFGVQVLKNVDKVTQYPIAIIGPSHGPVYDDPGFIIEAYRDWAGGEPQNIVCLPYVTMHGSTRLMVDYLTAALTDRGVAVERFDLTTLDAGELASSLVHAGTIVLGTPTVLGGPHPLAMYAAALANALRPRARFATVIGSYGWAGKTVETLAGMMGKLKLELLEPVLAKGMPREADYVALDALADAIAEKHKDLAPRNFADLTVCNTDH